MKKFYKQFCITTVILFLSAFSLQAQITEPITLKEALELAPQQQKKILVDVYATWCPYCQRMHSEVYPSEGVQKAINDYFLWVKIDVESDEMVNYHGEKMTQAQFANALENANVPTAYFLNQEGAILGKQPGFIEEKVFLKLLNFVGSDAYLDQSFNDYTGKK